MKYFFAVLFSFLCAALTCADEKFVDIAPALGTAWVEGNFSQKKTIVGLPLPLISSGTFSVQGGQLRWLTLTPLMSELHFSSAGISQWQEGEKTWEMTAEQQPVIATISQLMLAMMAGQWQTLDQSFRVDHFARDEHGCWLLDTVSKDVVLSAVVQRLLVSGCERVTTIELREVSGTVTALAFSASALGEQ